MDYNSILSNFIFGDIENKRQKKEMGFISCYHIKLLHENNVENKEEYKEYINVLNILIKIFIRAFLNSFH